MATLNVLNDGLLEEEAMRGAAVEVAVEPGGVCEQGKASDGRVSLWMVNAPDATDDELRESLRRALDRRPTAYVM